MKKFVTKPVLAVLAAATIAGGLTPVLANADTILSSNTGTKVVMKDDGQEVTRYHLKTLKEEDPALLNLLLKTQADHLYLIVEELDLDVKMFTYIDENEDEWNRIYKEHYDEIYLEVRLDDQEEGFVNVKHEAKDGLIHITGEVSDDVDEVVVVKPNGDAIKVVPGSDDTFSASFAATASATAQYVKVKAYVDGTLVDTKQVRINAGTVVDEDAIIQVLGAYLKSDAEVKVNGVVSLDADEVYVIYDGEKKEADLKKLWDGVGSFNVTFKNVTDVKKEATVEVYKDGVKVDSETVTLVGIEEDPATDEQNYKIAGTATISANQKQVHVKGKVEQAGDMEKAQLFLIAPDGKKHEVKLSGNQEFDATISYQNRSYSAKAVHLQLYVKGELVAQANIPYGTPVNQPVTPAPVSKPEEGKGKTKIKVKGKQEHQGNGNILPPGLQKKISLDSEVEVEIEWEDDDHDDDDDDKHKNGKNDD